MLSARELNSRSLPSRTWINEHLTFTHGYGLTLGPVNEVTPEGLPVLFIRDLPPVSTVDLKVTQPAIYFGELSNDHVFVKTKTRGVRLPARRRQRLHDLQGHGGVPLSNVLRRLMFAIRFRSTDTFFSPNLTPEPRDDAPAHPRARQPIAPFLATIPIRTSRSPTAVSSGCRTPTRRATAIPIRRPAADVNYIRNS